MTGADLYSAPAPAAGDADGGAPQSVRRVLFASLIGTSIEFFDFYIAATAALLVFPRLFFPAGDATSARLQSLATFGLAFLARPVGSALFGHFGDRVGRKATLVAALLTMGISTVLIGLLPPYAAVGVLAPVLLALLRFGQGLGLGGEWGGAVLLATENAPPGKQSWYGMFPQFGAPIGFLSSSGTFLLLSTCLTDTELFSWGWRIPFLASAVLVLVGLYVRLRLVETPAFRHAIENNERVRVPALTVLTEHLRALLLGTCAATATFVLFYLMTVFSLSWGTSALGYTRARFLIWQMLGVLFFALMIPVSAAIADRSGRKAMLGAAAARIIAFGPVCVPCGAKGLEHMRKEAQNPKPNRCRRRNPPKERYVVGSPVAGRPARMQRRPAGSARRSVGGGTSLRAPGLSVGAFASDHQQSGMGLAAATLPADRGRRPCARLRW